MAEIVVPMKLEHVRKVVDVHLQSFQGFFLTFLGESFLSELYRGIITDPSGIAFVAVVDARGVGFVAGTDHPAGFYKRLLRHRWWRFAWAAAWPALQKPSIIPRLLRSFSRSKGEDVHIGCAMLMSIAVAPEAQGMDFGKQLVKAFLDEAARRGCAEVNLTTDHVGNEATNQFYQRYGFRLARSYTTPEGREMNEYIINLRVQ